MVERVFLHIGLPKTGTSYLQTILWSSRPQLAREGVVLPGRERRDHLWASRIIRQGPHADTLPRAQRTAWDRIRTELRDAAGTGLVSHEFFASASPDQARRVVDDLAPAEVHLVVTARNALDLFTASWQESLKNKSTVPMQDYSSRVSKRPTVVWNWRALDLRLVLRRWTDAVSPDRIHVLPVDTSAPRDQLWETFAETIGLNPVLYDTGASFPNVSMGVVEAETLRRVNRHLVGFDRAFDRGVWIRTFLADERLVPRGGDRYWPLPEQVEECRRRSRRAVRFVRRRSFDVRGDLAHLLVPDELPDRRTPDTVTDREVAQVAVELVATLLADVRAEHHRARTAEPAPRPRFQIGRFARRKKRWNARS
jgi:hypothetical protein